MIQQEILKGLKLNVGNGGMSLTLEPKKEEKEEDKCQDLINVSSWADSDTTQA